MIHYEVVVPDDKTGAGEIVAITPDLDVAAEIADMCRKEGKNAVEIRRFE